MPEGVIVGGWPFVIAAYSITGVALAAHLMFLFVREKSETGRSQSDD